jgi:hypothetical protein
MAGETETIMIHRFGGDAHGIRIPAGTFGDWLRATIANGYFREGPAEEQIVPWHAVAHITRHWLG